MNDLLRRQRALEKTMRKYRGKDLDWRNVDCVRMFRSYLVAAGKKKLPKLPRYSTPLGAAKALKKAGFDNLEQLLDATLPRIGREFALPGDIVLLKGEAPFDSITLLVSARKVWGFHQDSVGPVPHTPHEIIGVWRA